MKSVRAKLALAALVALLPATRAIAAGTVATDGSLGHATNLTGPNFAVTSDLGKQVGPNLFHSFSTFNLDKGETATFSGPTNVSNVIARVTGGTPSSIDGTIQCTIPSAHFYLINPSGILFGPDATLDVKGSFVVTTADYLKFADGSHFNATHLSDTTLTSAAPAAFGFLASNPAGIGINGTTLSVAQGQTITLVGSGVQIVNGTILAPSGRVNLVSAAGSGELTLDATSLTADIDLGSAAPALGDVSMTSSVIGVGPGTNGPGGGRMSVRAGSFEMVNSDIFATNVGAADGLGVDIVVTGKFTLAPGVITTDSSGTGQAGNVNITASDITIDGTGQAEASTGIATTAAGAGHGGDIRMQTGSLTILGGSTLFGGSFAAGDGGSVIINATGDVHVDGTSTIFAPATSSGRAGDITISAGSLELTNGARISATTNSTGNAGNITINAGTVAIDDVGGTGSSVGIVSASFPTGAGGNAGQIVINTSSLSVTQGAVISTSSFGMGAAGSITISGGSVTLDGGTSTAFTGIFAASFSTTGGAGGTVAVSGTNMQVINGALVEVATAGAAAAGSININVADLTLDNRGLTTTPVGTTGFVALSGSSTVGSQVTVVANTVTLLGGAEITVASTGGGNAGTLSLTANQSLTLDGQATQIFTGFSASSLNPAGNAGNVHVTGGTLSVVGGAEILAESFGSGSAGTITIAAAQSFTLDDQSLHLHTGVLADNMDGPGGTVQITGGNFTMTGGAEVSADSFGAGPGGTVTINVRNMTGQGTTGFNTLVSADAFGTGPAGTINVTANSFALTGTASINADTSGPSAAGTVNVTATSLTLNGAGSAGSIEAETLASGNGGTVTIKAGAMQVLNGSMVDANTTGSGNGGTVYVIANTLTLDSAGSAGFTGLFSESVTPSTGSGGAVIVQAGSLIVTNNALIDGTTFGAGAAGGINVKANSILLENGGSITSNTQGLGVAGNIVVQAGSLQILNGSQITSDTLGAGNGGKVAVNVTGALTIDAQTFSGGSATGITAVTNGLGGNAGSVTVQAGSLLMRNHGAIGSDNEAGAGSIGDAGDVSVTANSINVQSTASISSGTFGSGNGGDVTVTGNQIVLNGDNLNAFTGITAQTDASGHAGAIHVSADSLQLTNGGEIGSSTFATGAGGSVYISATELTLKKDGVIDSASASTVAGSAGTVHIHVTDALRLYYHSVITSRSHNVGGGGGDVTIFAGNTIQLRGSKITTQAVGEGGRIIIDCPGTIDLINSQSLTKAGDNGGNMIIDPSLVVLENSHLSANGGIKGGNISVQPNFLLTSQSTITATGARGVSGMLQITPDYNLTGALLSLPATLSDSLALQPQCAADLAGNVSSFIVTGRGGEPLTPGGFAPAWDLQIPARSKSK